MNEENVNTDSQSPLDIDNKASEDSSGTNSPRTPPSDEEQQVEFGNVQIIGVPGRGFPFYVPPPRQYSLQPHLQSHLHALNQRKRSPDAKNTQTATKIRAEWRTLPHSGPNSSQPQRSRQIYTTRSVGSWRNPEKPSKLKLERGLIVWLPKKEQIPLDSVIHRHQDFQAGEEWAFDHPSLIWSDPSSLNSTMECLKITSFRQYQTKGDTTKTAAARKWDREGAGALVRRKLYLPIWDGKENTLSEHRDLDIPILYLEGGKEWMSYVNIERTFEIERILLEPYPDGEYILGEESLRKIEIYRKQYLASKMFLESDELNSKRQRMKDKSWRSCI
jgi:hypothetical protein